MQSLSPQRVRSFAHSGITRRWTKKRISFQPLWIFQRYMKFLFQLENLTEEAKVFI